MELTYAELKELIEQMPVERQQDVAKVFVRGVGEIYTVSEFGAAEIVDQNGDAVGQVSDYEHLLVI